MGTKIIKITPEILQGLKSQQLIELLIHAATSLEYLKKERKDMQEALLVERIKNEQMIERLQVIDKLTNKR